MFSKRIEPGPGQESVWDYPRPPRLEDVAQRVKVLGIVHLLLHVWPWQHSRRLRRISRILHATQGDVRKETMKAAGTVTKKLAKWLAEKGYVEDTDAAEERAAEATVDLPAAQDVLDRLEAYLEENVPSHYTDQIEDHFWVKKIEPGKLWLQALTMHDDLIGPVPVPKQVTQLCGEMWDISGVVVKTKRGWRLLEVWNVTP